MGSDIALAIDYSQTGDDWWFALTLTFFLLPAIGLLIVLCLFAVADESSERGIIFKSWKLFECLFESCPQLVLQLYIMTLPNSQMLNIQEDNNSTLPKELNGKQK